MKEGRGFYHAPRRNFKSFGPFETKKTKIFNYLDFGAGVGYTWLPTLCFSL